MLQQPDGTNIIEWLKSLNMVDNIKRKTSVVSLLIDLVNLLSTRAEYKKYEVTI